MKKKTVYAWYFEVGATPELLLEEAVQHRPMIAPGRHWEPRADLLEEDSRLIILVDLAGVHPEDVQISYIKDENLLLVKGVRNDQLNPNKKVVAHQLEILFGPFSKAIPLPNLHLHIRTISASYKHGILSIIIPKQQNIAIDDEPTELETF